MRVSCLLDFLETVKEVRGRRVLGARVGPPAPSLVESEDERSRKCEPSLV